MQHFIAWLKSIHWHFGGWQIVEYLEGDYVKQKCLYCDKTRIVSSDTH